MLRIPRNDGPINQCLLLRQCFYLKNTQKMSLRAERRNLGLLQDLLRRLLRNASEFIHEISNIYRNDQTRIYIVNSFILLLLNHILFIFCWKAINLFIHIFKSFSTEHSVSILFSRFYARLIQRIYIV